MRHLVCIAATAAALAACGGGGGGDDGITPGATAASVNVSAAATTDLASFGDTRAFTAVVRDASGGVIANAPVSWTSTPAGVVTLSSTSGLTTTATAAQNGTATVTATSGTVSGSGTVTIAQRLAAVKASPASLSVTPGGTRQLNPVAADLRDNAIAGVTGFTYASSNNAVATVSTSGLVSGVANGLATVTISLTRDGVTASAPVSITVAAAATSASVAATAGNLFEPAVVEIAAGGTVTWNFAAQHNVSFLSQGSPADVPVLSSGSASRTFPNVGTYDYTCTLHAGMNGQVIVR